MQPTDHQVQLSLEALRTLGPGRAVTTTALGVEVPEGLLDLLRAAPAVRLDRMADAMMRLAGGRHPTDDDVARRLVGRLVCDRLR